MVVKSLYPTLFSYIFYFLNNLKGRIMAKSPALVRAETKLKKLVTEVKATEKRIKALIAKDAKAANAAKAAAKASAKKLAKKVVKKSIKKVAKKTAKKLLKK